MNLRRLLPAFVLCGFLCTVSYAEPTAKLSPDGASLYAEVGAGHWFDLILRIDPQGDPIEEGMLNIRAESQADAEFKAPILPRPDGDARYVRPFLVRIPTRIGGAAAGDGELGAGGLGGGELGGGLGGGAAAAVSVTAILEGKRANGAALTLTATTEFTPVDLAGQLNGTAKLKKPARVGEANAIVLDLTVAETYHVYGTAAGDAGTHMNALLVPGWGAPARAQWNGGGPMTPPGKQYEGKFQMEIPFVPREAGTISARVRLFWQPCTDQLCDPNEIRYLPLTFEVAEGTAPPPEVIEAGTPTGTGGSAGDASGASGDDDVASKSLWEIAFLAFLAGLFALLMPCTYPLIPITISFFTKQAENEKKSIVPLALAYGLGIIAIFIVAGAVIGQGILTFAALWWVNALFAAMFLIFGLSLIGLYEIRLPSSFDNLAMKATGTGGYFSVFAMGATLVITSFTCTAPFVGSLLVFAAEGGSIYRVAFAMAVFGLTMAVPFVFLALSPRAMQALPRSGSWMKTLKVTLGIIELGLVFKFLSNVDLAINTNLISRSVFIVLWGASFLVAGLYLVGFFSLFTKSDRPRLSLGRMFFATLLLGFAGYLFAGLGDRPRYSRIEAFLPNTGDQPYLRGFAAVVKEDFAEGLRQAQDMGKPVFEHYTGYI